MTLSAGADEAQDGSTVGFLVAQLSERFSHLFERGPQSVRYVCTIQAQIASTIVYSGMAPELIGI